MERRYYLRGLGVGIAVTAVIMGVMTSRDAKMTDREVIARAKELGMVESTVLLDENDEASNGEEGADADNETEEEAGAAGEDPAGDGTVPDAGEEAGGKDANEAVEPARKTTGAGVKRAICQRMRIQANRTRMTQTGRRQRTADRSRNQQKKMQGRKIK